MLLKFDKTDEIIVRRLQKDARTNFASIAEECGVSVDTIIKRFERLKRNGVVTGTTILLDPRHFGYESLASIEIDADPSFVKVIVEQIKKKQGVAFCTPTMGAHNIFMIALLQNVKELNILRESVKSLSHVRDVKTSLWVEDLLLCPENFELSQIMERS
jgi:DNA-binding Lrp family transcriptional regulator